MAWIFAQFWLLLLAAFLVGAFAAWLVALVALPHAADLPLDAESGS